VGFGDRIIKLVEIVNAAVKVHVYDALKTRVVYVIFMSSLFSDIGVNVVGYRRELRVKEEKELEVNFIA